MNRTTVAPVELV